MRLLIDGIFFSISNTGIARVWHSIIPLLAARGDIEVCLLDRGGVAPFEGVRHIPFPTTSADGSSVFNYCAEESHLIQRMCDHYHVDVFTSTFFTSPLSTPTLLMVYDMIPELFGFDMKQSVLMEKEIGIAFAQRYLCISHNTRADLLSFYPEIAPDMVSVAHCGVDHAVFRTRPEAAVQAFRTRHGLDRPYFLFVGSRVQYNGYKNSQLFFDAVSRMPRADFDVFCVGGEAGIEPDVLRRMPAGVRCQRVALSDEDLSLAYNGAAALVYPSLYEGFGMPVIEAMASGCPVITTHHGSLLEAAGDAACLVSGTSIEEMAAALDQVREPGRRGELRAQGLRHAAAFRWDAMAARFTGDLQLLHQEALAGRYDQFLARWRVLRGLQASVDYQWIPPQ